MIDSKLGKRFEFLKNITDRLIFKFCLDSSRVGNTNMQ